MRPVRFRYKMQYPRLIWTIRRVLAREIEVEYSTRKVMNTIYDLGIDPETYGSYGFSDLDLVRLLRSNQSLPKLDNSWLKEKTVEICKEFHVEPKNLNKVLWVIGVLHYDK